MFLSLLLAQVALALPVLRDTGCKISADVEYIGGAVMQDAWKPEELKCTAKPCLCLDGMDVSKVILVEGKTGYTVEEDAIARSKIRDVIQRGNNYLLLKKKVSEKTATYEEKVDFILMEKGY